MAQVYARAIATAERLIAKKGGTVTWDGKEAPVEPADDSDWNPTPADDAARPQNSAKAVLLPAGIETQRTLQAITGTDVPASYDYALIAGSAPMVPALGDMVAFADNVKRAVVKVDTLRPDGTTAVLHTVWLQR